MLTTSDRSGLRMRGLADHLEHGTTIRSLRSQIYESLRGYLRLILVFVVILTLMGITAISPLLIWSAATRRLAIMNLMSRVCRTILKVLNIRVKVDGAGLSGRHGREGLLIIPNHITYLDVLVISSVIPAVFVTSRDIQQTPVLGDICKSGGCLFVERRHKWDLLRDIDQISQTLNQGFNVVLFPEGSTSNGLELLEYKQSLLESALRSRCKILPLCIRYTAINDVPFDHFNKDLVAWYGLMKFFPHIKKLVRLRSVDVQLTPLGPLEFRQHKSRHQIKKDIKEAVTRTFFAPI